MAAAHAAAAAAGRARGGLGERGPLPAPLQGGNLWEGDIEDVEGAACIVCPMHRYKINLDTGCKVDRMLCGSVCHTPDQKQRTYATHCDDTHIWCAGQAWLRMCFLQVMLG